jgi:hypothetical protein
MNYNTPPAKDDRLTSKSCEYKPLSLGADPDNQQARFCTCQPDLITELCHCAHLSNPWTRHSAPKFCRAAREVEVVAYIRTDKDSYNRDKQLEVIHSFCRKHGYHVCKVCEDAGRPSSGLTNALKSLERADAIIAVDLNRFVEHPADRMRDLRPFIHHFFCHARKHLISITEGIDTSCLTGQILAIDLINQID